MSEENNNAEEAQPAEVETPTAKTFTEGEVAEIVKKRLDRANRKYEAELARLQPEPAQPQSNGTEAVEALQEQLSTVVNELKAIKSKDEQRSSDKAFSEYMAAKGVDAKHHSLLRPHFNEGDTSKIDAFIADFEPKEPEPESTYQSPGAPATTGVQVASNPMTWSKDDIARFKSDGTLRQKLETFAGHGQSANPFARKG